ncbi:MAG: hypothetical protein JWM10_2564 [Myxococcaceae bacterium]|nr:hypothetical protein [Myxococcaceae bacterium]
MEEIPEEPAEGYRPELYAPRLEPPSGWAVESWADAQWEAADLLERARAAWVDVETKTGADGIIDLPASWICTRLLMDIQELANFVVTSPACGGDAPELLGALALPAPLDAINGVTGVDTGRVLHGLAREQLEAARRGDWRAVERLGARIAYTAREFAQCAEVFIRQTPGPPPPGDPLYFAALAPAVKAAAAGQSLGDPRAARLFDVLVSIISDMHGGDAPLAGAPLPLQLSQGRKSRARSLQAHAEVIEGRVFKSDPGQFPPGASGGALLRVALAVGIRRIDEYGAGAEAAGVPLRVALRSCWDQAATDPPVRELADLDEHARQLALRALDALGFERKVVLADEVQSTRRGGRAEDFRALGIEGQRRKVRSMIVGRRSSGKRHDAKSLAEYLGVPVAEVRAVMTANDSTKPHPKRG